MRKNIKHFSGADFQIDMQSFFSQHDLVCLSPPESWDDGKGRDKWICITPDIGDKKDPSKFKTMVFVE